MNQADEQPLSEGPDPRGWHQREVHELVAEHAVDPEHGLHAAEVERRLELHGPNELPSVAQRGPLAILAAQFTDFMVLVLLAAAVVSGLIGDLIDTLAILVIVVLNAVIGFMQSWRADRAMAALKQLAAARATVVRSQQTQEVAASKLVPGDIVLLEAGNKVPADLRLIHSAQLHVDESALTGESVTVAKHTQALPDSADSALGDRLNMAFKGTTATHGRARGLVVATGVNTELGKVAQLLDPEDRTTPLQRRLAAFGKRLALVVIGICVVIFVAGIWRGEQALLMALTAISLAVAAIPEALPAVVSVLLALGARRMVAVNALVRRLPSVETLGSVTTICSDKTGTLTQNKMHAELVWAQGQAWTPGDQPPGPVLLETLRAAALCNDAHRNGGANSTPDWQGDPTETALVVAAQTGGIDKAAQEARWPRLKELPFDSGRKRMTTLHAGVQGFTGYTKGAPESVLPCCDSQWTPGGALPLDAQGVIDQADRLAAQGLRVLALARRDHAALPDPLVADSIEQQLQFLGLIALIDPPRAEAAAAVRDCISAGITPVMATISPCACKASTMRIFCAGSTRA
jgi:Ca2+-transporting ATPase